MKNKIYILENLGCANCASKIERKILSMPEVEDASITFATKQLRLTAEDPDSLIPEIQKIANELEPDIKVTERKRKGYSSSAVKMENHHKHHHEHEHEHHHGHEDHHDSCGCGCEHEHHHEHEDHHDSCSCGCEHEHHHEHEDHHDSCSCGCEHEHHHEHEDHHDSCICGCGHEHHHEHENHHDSCSCGCEHEHHHEHEEHHKKGISENKKTLLGIGSGAVLFILGEILEQMGMHIPSICTLLLAYLILGGRIIMTAAKNLTKGHVFDENFLMSLATIGALAIAEYPEAVGVMLFYRIGEFFEDIAVERSRSQIMSAVDMRPEVVNLVSYDKVNVIPAEEANVGDIVLIRPGDRIPLDGVIVEGESLIDTSPVTGEPVPVTAREGDEIISGCVNTSGLLKMRVEKILEESMVTRILDSVENAAASKPKIDRFITRFARIYTPFVVLLASATAIIPSLITGDWEHWVYTALTFLVISCPCALVLSVPLAFFSGIGAGSKRGILFKGGVSLEAINNIKVVIMDKTGTITKGNFVVQQSVPVNEVSEDELLALCAGCELNSTHPIGNSIVTAAKEKELNILPPSSVEEIAGHGIRAIIGEDEILCGNKKLMDKFHIELKNYQSESFGTEVLAAKNGTFIGHLLISDTIKDDAKSAIAQMKKLGITTAMLTGDSEHSAQAVADATGIDEVRAKLLPEDKLTSLQEIRQKHGAVMFVGDGINDAPVLAGADVGAAMGSGADAAIEAADAVFMTSSMEAIPQAISIAKATSVISWQNVIFALAIKALVMILGLAGFASMWMAVFADTGVAMLCVLNSIRILYRKKL